ncbi:MAG TPA: hypothetical protein DDZ53_04260 [Firmicutes bacterium]|nr:hypothetical protein [Bacillota bacterium]
MPKCEMWKEFIIDAERAWLRVFDSGKRSPFLSPDGAPLLRLPMRWQRRRCIYNYFRRWWGPTLAGNMLRNLPIFDRGGCLYVAAYDVPPISLNVSQVTLLEDNNERILLRAVLTGGYDEPLVINYVVKKHPLTKHYMIVARSDYEDFRYHGKRIEE